MAWARSRAPSISAWPIAAVCLATAPARIGAGPIATPTGRRRARARQISLSSSMASRSPLCRDVLSQHQRRHFGLRDDSCIASTPNPCQRRLKHPRREASGIRAFRIPRWHFAAHHPRHTAFRERRVGTRYCRAGRIHLRLSQQSRLLSTNARWSESIPTSPTACRCRPSSLRDSRCSGAGIGRSRDFGQNGTYLVIRELAQDVEGFRRFYPRQSQRIDEGLSEACRCRRRNDHGGMGRRKDDGTVARRHATR